MTRAGRLSGGSGVLIVILFLTVAEGLGPFWGRRGAGNARQCSVTVGNESAGQAGSHPSELAPAQITQICTPAPVRWTLQMAVHKAVRDHFTWPASSRPCTGTGAPAWQSGPARRKVDCPARLAGCSRDISGDDISSVPVQTAACAVISHRGARVSVRGGFLHVAQRYPGVQRGSDERVP